ncbi:DUF6233 domain-containing protein [Streptomyces sp. NPDC048438]|uniref:DUF6233 domain-containing protein n=1 Tax=Streptomyces sp. NPDC048438 TaxID=3365551 RepID=UPI003717A91F
MALLHGGDCIRYPTSAVHISREYAVIALTEPDIQPCETCRRGTGLTLRGGLYGRARVPPRAGPVGGLPDQSGVVAGCAASSD